MDYTRRCSHVSPVACDVAMSAVRQKGSFRTELMADQHGAENRLSASGRKIVEADVSPPEAARVAAPASITSISNRPTCWSG